MLFLYNKYNGDIMGYVSDESQTVESLYYNRPIKDKLGVIISNDRSIILEMNRYKVVDGKIVRKTIEEMQSEQSTTK